MKIKKGDLVQVTVGKDKGRQGRVERVWPKEGTILIPGVNQYKRHRQPQGEKRPGEVVTLDRPISGAKVALVCPKCKQATRVGFRLVSGKKERVCRKCDMIIDEAKTPKRQAAKTQSKPQIKGQK